MAVNTYTSFEITISPEWVLAHKGDDELPVKRIIDRLQKDLAAEITTYTLASCEGYVSADEDSANTISCIRRIVESLYPDDKDFFTIGLSEKNLVPEEETKPVKKTRKKAAKPEAVPEETVPDKTPAPVIKETAESKIEKLIGMTDFKELVRECSAVAPLLKKYGTVGTFTSRCYLVSINDGCGLSTCLRLFAEFLEEKGLAKFTSGKKMTEVKLGPPAAETSTENPFAKALSCFGEHSTSRVVSIDISEWMGKTDDKEFRRFLRTVSGHDGGNIVFFRVPFVEKDILHSIHQSLNDLMFVRDLSVVPYSPEELDAFAERLLTESGFTMDEAAREVYRERITEEKNDGRFYGINTVGKVINEMIYTKQLSDARSGKDDTVIRAAEIEGLTEGSTSGLTGSEELAALVGMEDIQKKVEEIVAQIIAGKENSSLEVPCIHMRFVGNPGTGKTTVARIIGKILKEKGVLRNGSFFEYSGRDLCGRFVGQTAPKTAAICRDAYGSVLFIDEAYSLYRDEGYSTADYGREALDTLVAEMENHRSDFMVIMAGYPDEMEKLMHGNTGLASRMPYQIDFPNYSRTQLGDIFISMAQKSFTFDDAFRDAVKAYFDGLPDELMERKDFSNARFVRNLYERTWGKAVLRSQMAGEPCNSLTAEDFSLASSEKDFGSMNEKKTRAIGFI
ncbi:MAG: AAA family ATPase [Ruminococcus sp.]|nr:AAA family ATPase [Ruminococcus sp.]